MSGEKDVTAELSRSMGVLTGSARETVAAAIEEIERLRTALASQQSALRNEVEKRDVARADAAAASKLRNDVLLENESLRVRLHSSELDLARLRGYQDRVNQFDPVSDREAYADGLPRRRDPLQRDYASVAYTGDQDVLRGQERPWFLRRGD